MFLNIDEFKKFLDGLVKEKRLDAKVAEEILRKVEHLVKLHYDMGYNAGYSDCEEYYEFADEFEDEEDWEEEEW